MAPSSKSLTYALATWGTVGVTTLLYRAYRRRRITFRERNVAGHGGLMPQVSNAVEALEWRATSSESKERNQLALEGADGSQYTWAEYYEKVQQFARALVQIDRPSAGGAQCGVAIHAFNEPNWFVSAMGALAAGWTVSGIYLTNTYEQASHVLRTSDVRVLVIEDIDMLDSVYKNVMKDFPQLKIVYLHGSGDGVKHPRVSSFSNFLVYNEVDLPKSCDLPGDSVASLVYTSGTTGNPKAVELSHSSISAVCAQMHARIPLDEKTVVVSYLPLSHIAAMGIDIFSSLFCGATVYFADSNALRGSLKDTLLKVRPTLFFGVPRVWEKMAAAMQAAAAKSYSKRGSGPVLKAIGSAAKSVGGAWWCHDTPEIARCLGLAPLFGFFKILVFRKVRKGCGLDQCKFLYTGAAPLSSDVLDYLRSVDLPLLEVFGMSESNGAIAVCGPNDCSRPLGACGRALPSGELVIADDGEITWRGLNNMLGYKGLADATEAAIPRETGFLHTGDIGKVDNEGYLYITGRKKDLIITAGGENVAPNPIEESLKSLLGPGAGHVVLIGDKRKYLTILIAPPEGEGHKILTPEQVETAMEAYNNSFAKSRAQRVQRAHVLEFPFGVATHELTPTMKLKRAIVASKYEEEIESMYQDGLSRLVGYSSVNIGTLDPTVA